MRPKSKKVFLEPSERAELEAFIKSGNKLAALVKRSYILLALDENIEGVVPKQAEIAKRYNSCVNTVYKIAKAYAEGGVDSVLNRKQRKDPPIKSKITGDIEARIVQLACSQAPEGRTRWTLRLLEEKVVELGIIDQISDTTIYHLLKKHR